MPDTDIAAAARRVAEDVNLGFYRPLADLHADLLALLPVLDAVGAVPGEDRVERMARGLVAAEGLDPDYRITGQHDALWTYSRGTARAAIALADAERAAETPAG